MRFNSRAREGRDHIEAGEVRPGGVSIHAPARGATNGRPGVRLDAAVSIHAPARGATLRQVSMATRIVFQFTRPRGARLVLVHGHHGLARFNSRAREGRDAFVSALSAERSMFQFTRPRGARLPVLHAGRAPRRVSIHAPARGATRAASGTAFVFACFNSRAREGRDRRGGGNAPG